MATATQELFNVVCMDCGQIFTPLVRTPLWWKAKQRADQGFLDAMHVSGEECGCVSETVLRKLNGF